MVPRPYSAVPMPSIRPPRSRPSARRLPPAPRSPSRPPEPDMQIGLLTDSLSTMTRAEALDTAAELGVETVEIGLGGTHGGWSPAPHADLTELLTDPAARDTLRRDITSRGLRLEAFNAAGNPLHPVEGARDDGYCAARSSSPRSSRSAPSSPCPACPPTRATPSPPGSPPSGPRRTCGCSNTSGPSPSTTGAPSPTRPAAAA